MECTVTVIFIAPFVNKELLSFLSDMIGLACLIVLTADFHFLFFYFLRLDEIQTNLCTYQLFFLINLIPQSPNKI